MSDNLPLCPCCGSPGVMWRGMKKNLESHRWIECVGCKIKTPIFKSESDAIAVWSRRATPDTSAGMREALQIALDESFKAPNSLDHPWDRGYRAGAAAVWAKLRDRLSSSPSDGG